jgi:hypothetical protein
MKIIANSPLSLKENTAISIFIILKEYLERKLKKEIRSFKPGTLLQLTWNE